MKTKSEVKNEITNCSFVGVQYDAKAVNAIETIALGLLKNAEGLKELASVLKASNVQIETMIKISP